MELCQPWPLFASLGHAFEWWRPRLCIHGGRKGIWAELSEFAVPRSQSWSSELVDLRSQRPIVWLTVFHCFPCIFTLCFIRACRSCRLNPRNTNFYSGCFEWSTALEVGLWWAEHHIITVVLLHWCLASSRASSVLLASSCAQGLGWTFEMPEPWTSKASFLSVLKCMTMIFWLSYNKLHVWGMVLFINL